MQNDAVKLLGPNGTHLLIGYGGTLEVDILSQALFPETSFVGNICGTYTELVELLHVARRGAVTLTSTKFELDNVNSAMDALREGRIVGRGVLVPSGMESCNV